MPRYLATALSLAILLSLPGSPLQAQNPPRPMAAGPGEIRGKVVDSVSARAIPAASITVRRASDSSFASGALVREDGTFRVEGLLPGSYVVRVRALGFAQLLRNVAITAAVPTADLGTIALKTVAAQLETQRVTAEREEIVVQADRTVYSTKNMPAATGGTAIDVLRNIPQVEVDASNRVSLRGNGNVVIQINGRATPLKGDQLGIFLAQLPANTLKSVEVAANPSAKDDPEGTAGIINIVLNQEAEVGLSGGLSANTSSTGQAGGSGNIGRQIGRFVGFVSANVFTDRRQMKGTIARENLVITTPRFVETDMRGTNRPLSGGGNLRSEYRFTKTNTLTLDAYLGAGHFENSSRNAYVNFDDAHAQSGAFHQLNVGLFDNFYQDWDLAFRRQGKPTEPQLTVEAEYSNNLNDGHVDRSGAVTQADPGTPASIRTEHDHAIGRYPYFTSKIDYTHPFDAKTKLDIGGKYQDRSMGTEFTTTYLDPSTGVYTVDAIRSTNLEYHEYIGGAYVLLSRAFAAKIQTQAGARLEKAFTRFELPLIGQRFDKRYASVYPSAIFTYNFSPMRLARVSYSRRVSRPNPWQLSPVEFRQDSRNVFRGNPNLGAEYTDALDFSVQSSHKWGSLQVNPYIRRTNNAVRNIQYIDANGITVGTFANLAHNQTIGADANVNYRQGPFTGGGGAGLSRYSSDARNLTITTTNLSTEAISWSARGNGTWKFSPKWDAQIFANYRAPTKTEGGSSLAFINMSFGGRYKVWGEQGNISLRVNDPFGLSKFGYRTSNGQIVEYSRRYFQARAVFLSISRNFGKALQLKAKSQSEDQAAPPPP
jgi:outer membrane receptor protein involved in Fe transport